ncbi:uncharacterized protein PgNI_02505 [Pyricularia grisea]|uniref:Amidohydrolase-related domain-containing protein n=1 Tax=Pyricularia grisea TaxID=148305 RepID=A0A6P8BJC9_PYRGI|nr:uncharacterized protein PgNI_02505 [Pyricularia grisea]TLD16682.1 hypothetical protein PgNI_02505 [Pyricularia grisea]
MRSHALLLSTLAISPSAKPPAGAWDTHVHVLNPCQFPYSPNRTYTPEPAPLSSLIANSYTDNIVIVRASVDSGPAGALYALKTARAEYPGRSFRATLDLTDVQDASAADFDALHAAGVRALRLYGPGDVGSNVTWVQGLLRAAAELDGVRRLGWAVSAMLPLATFAALEDSLLHDPALAHLRLIAEHNGSATPSDRASGDFQALLNLLSAGRLWVKLGALHRQSPGDVHLMKEVVTAMTQAAPAAMLWGSDWPHVNSTNKGLVPGPPLVVDTAAELEAIHNWVGEKVWQAMFVGNPEVFFGDLGKATLVQNP